MKTLTTTTGKLTLNVKKIAHLSPKQYAGHGKGITDTITTIVTF